MLPPGLRRRVERIARQEGIDARALVLTAVREGAIDDAIDTLTHCLIALKKAKARG